jgi:fibronectin type 3 domain-containing protein
MKKHIYFIYVLIILIFSPLTFGLDYILQWDSNDEADLAGYKVYVGTSSRIYGPPITLGLVTTYTGSIQIPEDAKTTYYFAVTAYDTSGLESNYSNEIFKEFDTRKPPDPPKNLRWFEKVISWIKKHLKFWV